MIDIRKDWLPLGTIVRLEGGERQIMIAGFMAINAGDGQAYDYVGYPYPEGKQEDQELFFDRELIEEVYQLGFLDGYGMAFWKNLENSEESYLAERARRARQGESDKQDGDVL